MSQRKPNLIFSTLVEAPDDFVGLVAYGIYKRRKCNFIQKYTATSGNPISDDILDNFHSACLQNILGYRTEANEIIQKFLQEYSDQDVEDFKVKLNEQYDLKKKNLQIDFDNKLERIKPSPAANIIQGAIGSFVFTMAIGVVVVIILGLRVGVGGLVEEFIRMLAPLKLPPA